MDYLLASVVLQVGRGYIDYRLISDQVWPFEHDQTVCRDFCILAQCTGGLSIAVNCVVDWMDWLANRASIEVGIVSRHTIRCQTVVRASGKLCEPLIICCSKQLASWLMGALLQSEYWTLRNLILSAKTFRSAPKILDLPFLSTRLYAMISSWWGWNFSEILFLCRRLILFKFAHKVELATLWIQAPRLAISMVNPAKSAMLSRIYLDRQWSHPDLTSDYLIELQKELFDTYMSIDRNWPNLD